MTKWKKPEQVPKKPTSPAGWAAVLPGEYVQKVRQEEQRKKNREYMAAYRKGIRRREAK